MRTRLCHLKAFILLTLVSLALASFQVPAQQPMSATGVSRQVIESRIAEVQAATNLDETNRGELIELYRRALGFIEAERFSAANEIAFVQARKSAPAETRVVRERLEQAEAEPIEVTSDVAENASAQQIEQRLQQERANQAAVAAKLGELKQQLAAEANRPGIVRQRLVGASQLTEELAGNLTLPPPPGESTLLTEARRWVLRTQNAAVNAEIRMLDQELLSQSVRVELSRAQRDARIRSLGRIDTRVTMLEELLGAQRRSEAEQITAETDLAAFGDAADHPLIRDLVEQNRVLGAELNSLTDKLEQAGAATTMAVNDLREIQTSFLTARQRLEIAGLSQALGQVLHEQRRDLPDLSQYRRHTRQRSEAIAEAGLEDIQLEAERRATQDTVGYIAGLLAGLAPEERDNLAEPMQELVTARRALLKNTLVINEQYLRSLGELEFQENQLQATADEFDLYLAERLLWVRSKGAIGIGSLLILPTEIIDFLAPAPWLEAVRVLFKRAMEAPWLLLVLLISGLLLAKTSALHDALRATARRVGNPADDSILLTVRAIGISILLALPWPLLCFVTGFELTRSLDTSAAANAIGTGVLQVTRGLFFLRAFRVLCITGGLAEAHFNWPASVTRALRRQLDQLLLTFLLPGCVMLIAFARYPAEFGGELGRITFVIATAGVIAFLFRLLRPDSDIAKGIRRTQGATRKISWLWLVVGTSIPFILSIAALAGYLYSALTLLIRLMSTLWLLFGLVFANGLATRWLLVVRRRIQYKAVLAHRAAERAEREAAEDETAGSEDLIVPIEVSETDIASLDADTKRLVNVALLVAGLIALSGIWSSLLPALGILRDITLWEFYDGAAGEQRLMPVTLADLALAMLYGFVSISFVRTVPSLLDLILRQYSSLTPGSRLAFATLARYGIVLVGVSLVAGTVGFNWGKIQWLVAALGVGIGFGLQEIVANFISGLIILVERPIRVGDLVTVGDVSGTVSRLQIRATTVTNFDRQELLVPNKEFITGRVLNWSLSDEILRLVVKVGVAYGTDMPKALALVRQAVDEHEVVLDEPPPLITFDDFGNNSLNITARCFIGALNKRRETMSDLNLSINQKFIEAGIVIAFPQRDVHLDTTRPLDIRIQGDTPAAE